MLSDEPRQILTELAESNGDVVALAASRREPVAEVWRALMEATEELGAGSVGDAAALAAMGMPISANAH
jgi:hypothetical protein